MTKTFTNKGLWYNSVRGLCLVLVFAASAVLASKAVAMSPQDQWRQLQEDSIRVAAFDDDVARIQKQMIQQKDHTPDIIFLGILTPKLQYIDPSDKVMRAFAKLSFVKSASHSKPGQNRRPTDKETGAVGPILYVTQFHWKNDKTVDLDGGSEVGFPGGRGWTYHLTLEHGQWVVTFKQLTSVS